MTENVNQNHYEKKYPGTRIITSKHRLADIFAREFQPDSSFDRFEAIHIFKRISSKLPRSSDKPKWRRTLIDHLELLVSMTQNADWLEGQPIVWMSVAETRPLHNVVDCCNGVY